MAQKRREIPSRENSDVIALSEELREDLAGGRKRDPGVEARRRRISYFMLFRLGLLAAFTLLAATTTWLAEERVIGLRDWLAWATIAAGYMVTLVFAWQLRPNPGAPKTTRQLARIAWAQSGFDLAFATLAVALTGGVDSGFAFLFLIAVLGAATMGDRRQIWTLAAACGVVYVGVSVLELLGVTPLRDPKLSPDELVRVDPTQLWNSFLRTTAGIALVATLSSYLNRQLLSSVSQLGSLRTLNENIVRSLSSGLLTVDQDGIVLFANPTAHELLGASADLHGLDCDELIPGAREHLDDSGGTRNRFELSINRVDDNRHVILGLSCSTLLDEHGRFLGHIINFQDVTELREMERVLRRNERLAAIGGLAASVAHEVRNPLAAISGCAELIEPELSGEDNQRLIRVIRRECERLADIVSQLLDYTRPRKLERTAVDLGRALAEFAEGVRADPELAEIELTLAVPDEAVEAELDLAQLTQVLWNLVRNGAQAMKGRGRLELGLQGTSKKVRLMVRDHGEGIPIEDLDRIFEPFYSTKEEGSGIGLAVVHRIIEEHGGQIQVHSSPGAGTRFLIELPR